MIPPLVSTPGINFTGPPTFTISDPGGSGTGATCVSVMTGPLPSDVVTYSTVDGWIRATVQGVTGLTLTGVTNAPVTNWGGQLEGPTGHFGGFLTTPTAPIGINLGNSPTYYANNPIFTGKNKLKASNPLGARIWARH